MMVQHEGEGFGIRKAPEPLSIVLVTWVGEAAGSRAAAAALACAAAEADRAVLLVELADGRAPRPSLVATAAARGLEERLVSHLPEAGVASRGGICLLRLSPDEEGLARLPAALPLVRDSAAVVHLPPALLQATLAEVGIQPTAALLRADLAHDRALAALAVGDLLARGLRVAVLERPLGWLAARRALLGALSSGGLPPAVLRRVGVAPDRDDVRAPSQ
jgi:hypothetical protein